MAGANLTISAPRGVGSIYFSYVFGSRSDQAVVIVLFNYVSSPAHHPGYGEYGCVEILWDLKCLVDGRRVEVHIGVELLFG